MDCQGTRVGRAYFLVPRFYAEPKEWKEIKRKILEAVLILEMVGIRLKANYVEIMFSRPFPPDQATANFYHVWFFHGCGIKIC